MASWRGISLSKRFCVLCVMFPRKHRVSVVNRTPDIREWSDFPSCCFPLFLLLASPQEHLWLKVSDTLLSWFSNQSLFVL